MGKKKRQRPAPIELPGQIDPVRSETTDNAFIDKVKRYIAASPGCTHIALGRSEVAKLAGLKLPVEIIYSDKDNHFEIL